MEEKTHYRDGRVVLYRRGKSKSYQARLKIGTGKGSWKRVSTGTSDIKEAGKIAGEKYDRIKFREREGLVPDTRSFKKVAEMAVQDMERELNSGMGKVSFKHYIGSINGYMIPYFKNTPIDKIDYRKMMEFNDWRINKMGRIPARSTLNNHNASLRRVFDVAMKQGWINQHQVPAIVNTGQSRPSNRRPYFTQTEYRTLYRFMRNWHKTGRRQITRDIRELLRDYVLILTNCGIRPGTETRNLSWKHIGEYTAPDGNNYLRMIVNGKTGSRELVARHGTRRYLRRIASRFHDLKDLDENNLYKVDESVFRLRNGNLPTIGSLNNAFKQCLSECDLLYDSEGEKRSLYSCRHTYITFAIIAGVDIHLLARQCGTSVGMIEKFYSHLKPVMSANILGGNYVS